MKKCSQCHRTKPLDDFPYEHAKGQSDKRRAACRECTNFAQTQRKYARREKDKELSVRAPVDADIVQPRRDNLFDRPVWVPPTWGR